MKITFLLACGGVCLAGMVTGVAPAVAAGEVAGVETQSYTHAGEGSQGMRRVFRDGCYQGDSEGGNGGGLTVHDREAGCAGPGLFEKMFEQLDALAASNRLVREEGGAAKSRPEPATHGRPQGAPNRRSPGGLRGGLVDAMDDAPAGMKPVVILKNGTRWIPANQDARKAVAVAIGLEPSIDAWYVKPPQPPVGSGPQLVALSVRRGSKVLQASLVADGRWWCHLSVPLNGERGATVAARPTKLTTSKAADHLKRILVGGSAKSDREGSRADNDGEISVQVPSADGEREAIKDRALAKITARRFVEAMAPQSTACTLP